MSNLEAKEASSIDKLRIVFYKDDANITQAHLCWPGDSDEYEKYLGPPNTVEVLQVIEVDLFENDPTQVMPDYLEKMQQLDEVLGEDYQIQFLVELVARSVRNSLLSKN